MPRLLPFPPPLIKGEVLSPRFVHKIVIFTSLAIWRGNQRETERGGKRELGSPEEKEEWGWGKDGDSPAAASYAGTGHAVAISDP